MPTTAQQRQKEFPHDTYVSGSDLFCRFCGGKRLGLKRSSIKEHIEREKRVRQKLAAAKSAEKQKLRQQSITAIGQNSEAIEKRQTKLYRAVKAFASAGLSMKCLAHPAIATFLHAEVVGLGVIPQADTLRRSHVPKVLDEHVSAMKIELAKADAISICVDESPVNGRKILNCVALIPTDNAVDADADPSEDNRLLPILLNCEILTAVNFKTVSDAVIHNVERFNIDPNKICAIVTDNAAYMTKAYRDRLQFMYPNAQHVTCIAHIIDTATQQVRDSFEAVNQLIVDFKTAFSFNTSERTHRFKSFMDEKNLPTNKPPEADTNRWSTWFAAAIYHAERYTLYPEFFGAEVTDSAYMRRLIAASKTKNVADDLRAVSTFGKFAIAKLTNYEGLGLKCHKTWDDITNMKHTLAEMKVHGKNKHLNDGVDGFLKTIDRYFVLPDERYCQPSAKFFCAVRYFDPVQAKALNVDIDFIFKNCRRFEGEELVLRPELNKYITMLSSNDLKLIPGEHPIDFWSRNAETFPHLSAAAKHCLVVVDNNVQVERSFSQYRHVMSDRRSSISQSNIAVYNMLYQNFRSIDL